MSDPRRPSDPNPDRRQWSQPTERLGNQYPPADPAYAGNYTYPSYVPGQGANPTEPLPPYWTQTQYPQQPPPQNAPPPPKPPKSPRWLWLLTGAAVLLVVGLVVALVIVNGSSRDDTAVAPLPPMPEPSATAPPSTTTRTPTTTRVPTTTRPPQTTTGPSTTAPAPSESGATENVVYTVSGEGRAISITYIDTGGMLQIEFNVVLPWTREVALSPTTAKAASVTVINVGREVSCSVTLNGTFAQQRSGTGLTICSAAG